MGDTRICKCVCLEFLPVRCHNKRKESRELFEIRLKPHPTPFLPHLNIDNNSLKSNNNPERIGEYVDCKALTLAVSDEQ
jgi:hypothetical protein